MSDSENTPNQPENDLTWLDFFNPGLNPSVIDLAPGTLQEMMAKPTPPGVRRFIEMALNPSNISGTNRMVMLPNVRWIDPDKGE